MSGKAVEKRAGIAGLVVGLLVITSWILVAGVCSGAGEARESTLSLEKAVEIALEHNPEITLAEFAVREAELAFKQAEANKGLNVSQEALTKAIEALEDARANLARTKMDVALDVEKAYYDVLKALDNLSLRERTVTVAEQQLLIGEKRFEAGLITEMDLMGLRLAVDQAKAGFEGAKFAVETAKINLNRAMGRALEIPVEVVPIPTEDYIAPQYDLEECVQTALASRRDIEAAREALADAKRNLELLSAEFTAQADLDRAGMAVAKAEINLVKAEQGVLLAVRGAYNAMVQASRNVDFKRRSVVQAEKELEVAQKRYQAGLISEGELEGKREALEEAKAATRAAIYDCKLAEANLLKVMGRPYSLAGQMNAE